jgi:hypothetical protein
MRAPIRAIHLGLLLAQLFICSWSFAQGCDQGTEEVDEVKCSQDAHGNWIYAPDVICSAAGAGAEPCLYCYEGHGQCSETGNEYSTANLAPDDSCPGCDTGCCANPTQCYFNGSGQACNQGTCTCQSATPIIVDTTGRGFRLTSAEAGTKFDIFGDGHPIQIAWTAAGSGNAFLALDRNHNGRIDNGKELFGNVTEQPESNQPNGFLALSEFDKPENGGNGDGIIDKHDAVFSQLLLWIDENHDGITQPNELHSLPELGVFSLGLRYRDDRHFFDEYGNWFRYQAALNPDPSDGTSKDGRVAYDVFFLAAYPDAHVKSSLAMQRGRNQWESSLDYDLSLSLPSPRKSGCPSRLRSTNSGGTR